jgi:threonine dehydratase
MITPNQRIKDLAKKLGILDFYLKREDLHPYLSHKGRSIPLMIDEAIAKNTDKFVISSSGNAALAAALYIKQKNNNGQKLSLEIFIGPNISQSKKNKLTEIADENIIIKKSPRPLREALLSSKKNGYLLRQSTSSSALVGYFDLAKELLEIKNLKAVFFATSSGTSAEGVAKYFLNQGRDDISIHIVQTTNCHPIASLLGEHCEIKEKEILADAIVDKVAHRKDGILIEMIRKSRGAGWIASNILIKEAINILEKHNIKVTPNGALSFAGLIKALRGGFAPEGVVVCIVGGQ